MNRSWLSLSVVLLFSGCATLEPLPPVEVPKASITPASPPTFLQYVSPETSRKQRTVTVNFQSIALADALASALPTLSVLPMDDGVDLTRTFAVQVTRMPTSDYLAYLSAVSGYDIELDGSLIRISSMAIRSWDMAFLATRNTGSATIGSSSGSSSDSSSSTTSSSGSGSSSTERETKIELRNDEDAWAVAVKNAQTILRLSTSSSTGSSPSTDSSGITVPGSLPANAAPASQNSTKAWLAADRRIGSMFAGGPPQQIRQLDRYFSQLADKGMRQIHLSLMIVDVVWNDSLSQGVDWSAQFNDGRSNLTLGAVAQNTLADAGRWAVSGAVSAGKQWTINVLLEMLSTNARSYTITRPSVTLLNGGSAYINVGEEFSYVANVAATPDTNGNVVETSTLERLGVGTKLLVSARTTNNNRILIDLVPEVSSVTRFRTLSSGTQTFETPVLAPILTATQVISRSGKPVFVGGLTSDKIARSLKHLPLAADNPLNRVLGSSLDETEHRELLFILTPQEVRS